MQNHGFLGIKKEDHVSLDLELKLGNSTYSLDIFQPQQAAVAEDRNNGGSRSENVSGSGRGNGRRRQSGIAYANDTVAVPQNMYKISGDVQCRRCEQRYVMKYDLREKFIEIWKFFNLNCEIMEERAPKVWMIPVLPNCTKCNQENSVKPIISDNKEAINWLFLLLGQMLGCCTLEQLKYFCKYTRNHRTGAKDRLLYLTYVTLIKQLEGLQFYF